MDIEQRRKLLIADRNPDIRLDYVASLYGHMTTPGGAFRLDVGLRYVPDRAILNPASFASYLNALGGLEWSSLEDVAQAMLNDINNELIGRWVQVSVLATGELEDGVDGHEVLLEDRQPNWDNPGLLSRLKRH